MNPNTEATNKEVQSSDSEKSEGSNEEKADYNSNDLIHPTRMKGIFNKLQQSISLIYN